MLKKVTALFLVLLLSSTSFPVMASAAEVGSLNNFQIINSYTQGQYKDVPETNTFAANIKTAYEYGLMQGYGESFGITSNITRMASIIIACRIHAIYTSGKNSIEPQC